MDRNEELRNYMKTARAQLDAGIEDPALGGMEIDLEQFDDGNECQMSIDEMIAFSQKRMAPAEREAARLHILQCDECLQLFKDVNDFFEPRREDEVEIGELQVRRAWKEFWPKVRDMIGPSRRKFPRAFWPMAAAAGLLLLLGPPAVLVSLEREGKEQAQRQIAQMQNEQSKLEARLGQIERNAADQLKQEREQRAQAEARAQTLQTQLNELRQARQNVPIYSRTLANEKGGADDWQLSNPGAAKTFWLNLDIAEPYKFPEYSIELLDRQGRSVAERHGLRPVGSGRLSFALSRSEAPAGQYSLLLYGHSRTSKQNLGKYELTLSFSR